MCSDPTHIKEFKDIATLMARMETKLDTVVAGIHDHEGRIRSAEIALVTHSSHDPEIVKMREEVDSLNIVNAAMSRAIESWRKIMWAMGTAAFSGLGLWIWRIIEGGLLK